MTRTCFCSPGGGFICTACKEMEAERAMFDYVQRGCTGEHGVDLDETLPALLRLQAQGLIVWEQGSLPSWKVAGIAVPLHVYPTSDVRAHAVTSDCWCSPRVEMFDPETQKMYAVPLVIHRDQAQRDKEAS